MILVMEEKHSIGTVSRKSMKYFLIPRQRLKNIMVLPVSRSRSKTNLEGSEYE
jgi:hypothetical protein